MRQNWEIALEESVKEVSGNVKLLRHKSGLEVLGINNADKNKVFAITFATPVNDSTGVAHILEHLVLNGSKKYPSKEPFTQLLKGSLKTFLNAFTSIDKTMYPIASENSQDFLNLMSVYLDAVFQPLLREKAFAQEGWRHTWENEEVKFKGVVFNEMKGAINNPDWVFWWTSIKSLYPNSNYAHESGGLPLEIVNLEYEKLRQFHKENYHPANAKIWLWGDFDWDKSLELIEEYTKLFEEIVDKSVLNIGNGKISNYGKAEYPVEENVDATNKSQAGWAWRIGEWDSLEKLITWQVLEKVLIGNSGSPLRKALIDSGWGSDLGGVGLETELKEGVWGIGLKDINLKLNGESLKKLIIEVLEKLANGLDEEDKEAAMNIVEFGWRERDDGELPEGLTVLTRAINSWIYNDDPLMVLKFEDTLARVRQKIKEGVLESLLSNLVSSENRVWVELEASNKLATEIKEKEQKMLSARLDSWGEADLAKMVVWDKTVTEWQIEEDRLEDIQKIPRINVSDIGKEIKKTQFELLNNEKLNTLIIKTDNPGITYGQIAFDLSVISNSEWKYLNLYSNVLTEFGADSDFIVFQRQLSKYFGGVGSGVTVGQHLTANEFVGRLIVQFKALERYRDRAVELLMKMFGDIDFDFKIRIEQMINEMIAEYEQTLVYSGHEVIAMRLSSYLNSSSNYMEKVYGVEQYLFLKELKENFNDQWEQIRSNLNTIHTKILKANIISAFGSDKPNNAIEWSKAINFLNDSIQDNLGKTEYKDKVNEALVITTPVNYVGLGGVVNNVNNIGAFDTIVKFLRTDYLWEQVRVRGGAYGVRISYDPLADLLTSVSYRDPRFFETWKAFDGIGKYLKENKFSKEIVDQAIIGMIAAVDAPMGDEKTLAVTFQRYLLGITDEWRQDRRDEILNLSNENFVQAGDIFEKWSNNTIKTALTDRQQAIEWSKRDNVNVLDLCI